MAFMALPAFANHSGDRNCDDFDSHAQAQAFFERHGGSESANVDGLDGDSDGQACEDHEYSGGGNNDDGDDDNAPPADDGGSPGDMPDTATPSGTAPILPLMLVGVFGASVLLLYRKRLAL